MAEQAETIEKTKGTATRPHNCVENAKGAKPMKHMLDGDAQERAAVAADRYENLAMPSAAIAATSDPFTVDSNIKFCCDPRRRGSRARLPCCSWLRHTIDSLLTPLGIRSGKNFFVTLLSTLGFLNRSGQIYIKSWGPGVQRPPAPRRSKLAPRSPQN